jgi:hypothetical protein
MTYIINPWMFYFISLSDALKWTTGILTIIAIIGVFMFCDQDEKIH